MNRRDFLSASAASALLPQVRASTTPPQDAWRIPSPPRSARGRGPDGRIEFATAVPAPGSLPAKWICGSPSAKDNADPPVQVHWYNAHTAVLRQNRAYAYEAPFMLLYFGNDRVLMIDQGDSTLREHWPLRDVVDGVIAAWCRANGRNVSDLELLLALSHLHMDHFSGQNQFLDRPRTRNMGLSHAEMVGFWGMTNYPEEEVSLDLGGRTVRIWGSPGHTFSEFAYYDTYTAILFTGDMFYRGRLYVTLWDAWMRSMERLVRFCDTHPVALIAGCHVEMGKGGVNYPTGNTYQPDEEPWHLTVDDLRKTFERAKTITEPGEYFAGPAYICRLDGSYPSAERNPYRY